MNQENRPHTSVSYKINQKKFKNEINPPPNPENIKKSQIQK
jgi:hypothetical protein